MFAWCNVFIAALYARTIIPLHRQKEKFVKMHHASFQFKDYTHAMLSQPSPLLSQLQIIFQTCMYVFSFPPKEEYEFIYSPLFTQASTVQSPSQVVIEYSGRTSLQYISFFTCAVHTHVTLSQAFLDTSFENSDGPKLDKF